MFGDLDETIAAVASPSGGGLRGLIRVSGPQAVAALNRIATLQEGRSFASLPGARCIDGRVLLGGDWVEAPARFFVWPDRHSYTGQPSAEIHTFGVPALLDRIVESLRETGVRLAQPGEFTFRAFLAGRIDLVQAEAVLGLIDAEGAAAFDVALKQFAGGLAGPLVELRERLLETLAHLEAGLDFVEEEIEFVGRDELKADFASAIERIESLASRIRLRGSHGRAPRIALVGAPNVGKSSLLNSLAGKDAAIVSEQAGTTRDWVVVAETLAGATVEWIDTAGLSTAPIDELDAASQTETRELIERVDVRILCFDATRPMTPDERDVATGRRETDLIAWTKCDLPTVGVDALLAANAATIESGGEASGMRTSSRTGSGIAALRDAALAAAFDAGLGEAAMTAATALRCGESLSSAKQSLQRGLALVEQAGDEMLVAAELRSALHAIGTVAGVVYTDDLLDRIFSRFCIGK